MMTAELTQGKGRDQPLGQGTARARFGDRWAAGRTAGLEARPGGGLAGGRRRDVDGLVERRDSHRGVDGLAVDRHDLGEFPQVMLAVDPDAEAYGAVA